MITRQELVEKIRTACASSPDMTLREIFELQREFWLGAGMTHREIDGLFDGCVDAIERHVSERAGA